MVPSFLPHCGVGAELGIRCGRELGRWQWGDCTGSGLGVRSVPVGKGLPPSSLVGQAGPSGRGVSLSLCSALWLTARQRSMGWFTDGIGEGKPWLLSLGEI